MKSTKKLLIATLLLVLALTAVVSSTFAWFTMQANPEIESIKVNVTAGEGLRMSLNGEDGTFKSFWSEQEFIDIVTQLATVELDSITPKYTKDTEVPENSKIEAGKFEIIRYQPPTLDVSDPYYYYEEILEPNKNYLKFDLWFEADREVDVYLQTGRVSTQEEKVDAINSARFGFVDTRTLTDMKIYDPRSGSGSGDFGNGKFFGFDNINGGFKEMLNADHALLKPGTGEGEKLPYEMTEAERITANNNATFDFENKSETILFNIPDNTTRVKVTVYFWIEGWDGDCTDAAKGAIIDIFLRFIGVNNTKEN